LDIDDDMEEDLESDLDDLDIDSSGEIVYAMWYYISICMVSATKMSNKKCWRIRLRCFACYWVGPTLSQWVHFESLICKRLNF